MTEVRAEQSSRPRRLIIASIEAKLEVQVQTKGHHMSVILELFIMQRRIL